MSVRLVVLVAVPVAVVAAAVVIIAVVVVVERTVLQSSEAVPRVRKFISQATTGR